MTNFNEKFDEILAELLWCDKSKAHLVQHYTHRRTNHRAGANAKADITSLIKELVAEAKPKQQSTENMGDTFKVNWARGHNIAIDQFEQNLLKALEEV